ncbi:MAG: hypothetical protein ACYCTI_05680 [Acidimicrobiales bacterium]
MNSSDKPPSAKRIAHVALSEGELRALINALNEAWEALSDDDFEIRTTMSLGDSKALSARLREEVERLGDAGA